LKSRSVAHRTLRYKPYRRSAEQERGQDALATAGETPALRAPLQIDELLDLTIQIANGLDAAHHQTYSSPTGRTSGLFKSKQT